MAKEARMVSSWHYTVGVKAMDAKETVDTSKKFTVHKYTRTKQQE